jgi:glycosyltransferase involved in cell wall biosynthesis
MKKVLIFSLNYYPSFIGGAEVAIKEITDRISPDEVEFHMVTLRFDRNLPKVEKIGNVLIHRIGFAKVNPSIAGLKKFPLHLNKYYYQLLAARAAAKLHKKYQYDSTWAMMAHSTGIPAGIFKKSHPGVRYLLTLQEGDPPEYIEQMMRPVSRLFSQAFTAADALQPISTFLQKWGIRMGFAGSSTVIPNGVDVSKFSQNFTTAQIQEEKERLGKKDGNVYVVTTSRLVHKNAIDDVIRAMPLLPESIVFLVYGIGPDEEKLKRLAEDLLVSHRVRFMGQIAHAQMPLMLQACDVFTRPSRSEGMGNSFIEAMAAGIPVIATQEGGIADFLFDETRNPEKETTGWAVDKDAPEQIANAVLAIISNPKRVAAVTETARKLAQTKYNWDDIANSMGALFKNTL